MEQEYLYVKPKEKNKVKDTDGKRRCDRIFIVMDFIEHDLKTLLSSQTMPFLASEIKTLLHQLLSAMSLLHRNWIIHRDLKTSNLLMNNRGQLKLADFGLARMYGEPRGEMTQLVVTLWYRFVLLCLVRYIIHHDYHPDKCFVYSFKQST